MKFGKLEDISGVDFQLPPDPKDPAPHLATLPERDKAIYLGGTMWNIRPWKETLYPPGTRIKDFPIAYCQQFGTIELNATHYKIHPPQTIAKWEGYAPEGFKFCPKFPNLISHYRQFLNVDGLTDEFLTAVQSFGPKLGPCFLQLPPRYSPKHASKLQTYLRSLPRDMDFSVEFRHEDWFTDHPDAVATWDLLEELGMGSVISATAGRRDALHMRLTSRFLLLRFGGYELHPSDTERWKQWTERLVRWMDAGLREVHILMHQPDSILTPESCKIWGEMLREATGLEVKLPRPRAAASPTLF